MSQITFASSSSNSTFHVLADKSTAESLLDSIYAECSGKFKEGAPTTSRASTPAAFNDSAPNAPGPASAVQYYRASSVVLTLDGYNNTAALNNNITDATEPLAIYNVPLPNGTDTTLLGCLNNTIGAAVPLSDHGIALQANRLGVVSLAWVLWYLIRFV
jgi:hypothetical protein